MPPQPSLIIVSALTFIIDIAGAALFDYSLLIFVIIISIPLSWLIGKLIRFTGYSRRCTSREALIIQWKCQFFLPYNTSFHNTSPQTRTPKVILQWLHQNAASNHSYHQILTAWFLTLCTLILTAWLVIDDIRISIFRPHSAHAHRNFDTAYKLTDETSLKMEFL